MILIIFIVPIINQKAFRIKCSKRVGVCIVEDNLEMIRKRSCSRRKLMDFEKIKIKWTLQIDYEQSTHGLVFGIFVKKVEMATAIRRLDIVNQNLYFVVSKPCDWLKQIT